MSSALRYYAQNDNRKLQYFTLNTPCYYDYDLGWDVPVPFVYSNGVVDIANQDNSYNDLIDSSSDMFSGTYVSMKEMGGLGLATELGPNFLQWLNNWWGSATFTITQPAQMVKIQYALDDDVDDSYDIYMLNAYPNAGETMNYPPADGLVTGDESTRYRTCWVFKTPLVVKMDDGSQYYRTFHSQLGYNNEYVWSY